MESILSNLLLLLVILITIVFAYYITTIIGKKTRGLMQQRSIQVLERTIIGLNTNITIVKVQKKIYIIALQGKTIQLLDIIDEENWDFQIHKNEDAFNFKYDLNDIFKRKLFKK